MSSRQIFPPIVDMAFKRIIAAVDVSENRLEFLICLLGDTRPDGYLLQRIPIGDFIKRLHETVALNSFVLPQISTKRHQNSTWSFSLVRKCLKTVVSAEPKASGERLKTCFESAPRDSVVAPGNYSRAYNDFCKVMSIECPRIYNFIYSPL